MLVPEEGVIIRKNRPMSRKTLLPLLFTLILAVTACVSQREERGYVRTTADFSRIIPGTSTNKDVVELLGTPSSYSSYGDETWYYISAKRKTIGFLPTEITDQGAVAIVFNKDGVVRSVEEYGKKDRRDIAYSGDRTPTEGNQITIWQQVLGNLGKFNTESGGLPGQHGGTGGGASPY